MRIIAGIIVSIVFIITLAMFIHLLNNDERPFGMALWLFLQTVIDFVVALLLFKI